MQPSLCFINSLDSEIAIDQISRQKAITYLVIALVSSFPDASYTGKPCVQAIVPATSG